MKILEAIEELKADPSNINLVNAITDCFDAYLDVLEEAQGKNAQESEELYDQIDAVSEMADTIFAYKEEYKSYVKASKADSEADASQLLDIISDLESYLHEYAEKYSGLEAFIVNNK